MPYNRLVSNVPHSSRAFSLEPSPDVLLYTPVPCFFKIRVWNYFLKMLDVKVE